MKTFLALCVSIALLPQIAAAPATTDETKAAASTTAPAQNVPATQPAAPAKGDALAALEQKLLGTWRGLPCEGNYTFNADGTYELENYTPGGITLTGTWSLRWDALPPTLLLTCKTSDIKKKFPDWPEYNYLGKTREVKLLELNDDTLAYRVPGAQGEWRGSRPKK
ncbi:MAG: hypothetical protein ACHRHE_12870 [Tepidisphaerales bacterium]